MEHYIYMDVFFLRVFTMNLLCLKSLSLLLQKNSSWKRLSIAAAAGAGWNGCLILYDISIKGLSMRIPCSVLTAGFMCSLAYGSSIRKKERTLPFILLFIAFGVEGSMRFTGSLWGIFPVPIICFLIGRERKKQELEIGVVLYFKGRQKKFNGFRDSGNRLMEPITGKKVHIICYEEGKELLPKCYREAVENYFETGILNSTKVSELQMYEFTFLSYHSIGKENGQLLGIRMDSAEYISTAGRKTEERVVIALTREKLFVRGRDRMIVNGRLEL